MSPAMLDGLLLLASVLGIGGLVAVGEGLRRRGVSSAVTRRLVHAGVCLFVALTPLFFSGPTPVCLLAGGFVLVNGVAWAGNRWPSLHAARRESWGTVAVPLAVLPAAAATWSVVPDRVVTFQVAFLVLGSADPVAAWVGDAYGGRRLTETASLPGSASFLGVSVGVVGATLLAAGWEPLRAGAAAGIAGLVTTAVEAVSRRGWDNLFVVLAAILVLVPLGAGTVSPQILVGALGAGLGFGAGAYYADLLDPSGAVGGGLFAASLVGLGGTAWVVPGLAFFVLSSALSLLPVPGGSASSGRPRRTLRQVLANGGVAWTVLAGAALVPPGAPAVRAACYAGFAGALAAAAADTWATELGTRYAGAPFSLRRWTRVARGTSGAVTGIGTGAAVLGAATVAAAAGLSPPVAPGAAPSLWTVLGAGVVGMGLDSAAGATVQAQYEAGPGPAVLEHPLRPDQAPVRGRRGVDNDVVNLLGTAGGAAAALLLWGL